MDSNDLTIVIVTFNSELKIADCLKSIENKAEIIVVENSNNETFKKNLENQYQNLKCILTGGNKGYAVANNIGLKNVKTNLHSPSSHFLVLPILLLHASRALEPV